MSLDFIGYAKRLNHGKYEVETIYPRPGTTGPEGKPGEAGRKGPQGQPGAQGDRGKQGTEGEPGAKGKPGRSGPPGIGGEPGLEGETGSAGNTGRKTIATAAATGALAIVIGHHLIIRRRKPYKSLALAAMIGLLALPTQQAQAQVEPDHLFTGRVTTHDEIVASDGATVTALILGKETGKAIVKDGRYKISTRGRIEEEITFFLDGIPTAQSHIWSQGGNTELDLTRVDYVEAGKYLHEKAGCHGTINERGLTIHMSKEQVAAISKERTRLHRGAPRGIPGPRGKQGTQGEPGPNGEKGPEGSTGTQGEPGPQGSPGKAGPQGAVGNRGEKGPEGPHRTTRNAGGIRGCCHHIGSNNNPLWIQLAGNPKKTNPMRKIILKISSVIGATAAILTFATAAETQGLPAAESQCPIRHYRALVPHPLHQVDPRRLPGHLQPRQRNSRWPPR